MNELDQTISRILDLELLMKIRDAGALNKFKLIRVHPFSTIKRLSKSYWSMDVNDIMDLQRSAWNTYLSLIDISELTDLIQR